MYRKIIWGYCKNADSCSGGLEWGPKFCISNKSPDDLPSGTLDDSNILEDEEKGYFTNLYVTAKSVDLKVWCISEKEDKYDVLGIIMVSLRSN
jgi:hypothetical protein